MKNKNNIFLRIKKYFNTQSPPSFDKFAAYCSILGLLFAVLSFLGLNYSDLLENPVCIVSLFMKWFVDKGCILLIAWIFVILVIMTIKYRSSTIIKMNAISSGLSRIMIKTLELINSLNESEKALDEKSCGTCNYAKKVSRRWLYNDFIQYTIAFLDELAQIMTDYVSYDVSTCVKLIADCTNEQEYSKSSNRIEGKKVVTLARNRKSNEIRNKIAIAEPVSIDQNSDFYDIVNGERTPYFYVPNLKTYSREIANISDGRHIYLNSTPNWWDYYIGTVVVPIGHTNFSSNKNDYTVWGFLCIDSLSENAFTWKQKDINIKILQSFANIYSLAVKEYDSKFNKLMEDDVNNNV